MVKKLGLAIICLTLFVVPRFAWGQNAEVEELSEKDLLKKANWYFEKENYLAALPLYDKLYERAKDNTEYTFLLGVCYTFKSDDKDQALEMLEKVLNVDPKYKNLNFQLGRAYHINNKFDDAIKYFNLSLTEKKANAEKRKDIERLIENCKNGKELIKNPLDVQIENIGPAINSKEEEYVPVISSDESVLIFTYKGERSIGGLQDEYGVPDPKGMYSEDILVSYKLGNIWLTPQDIGSNINSAAHDACIALSGDGQKLFVYKDSQEGSGDIYESVLDSNVWTSPVKMNININSEYWEGSASLSPDEKTIYFTSEKPGGFGGRDIYKSSLREDGIWDEAVNLGPAVNTPYDDDAPFIHPDGKTLYFSSQGHNSMGGFDIFFTEILTDTLWAPSQNIGYPINTSGNDIFYVVSANSKRGYYSSERSGGFGQHDIFIVHQGQDAKKHALLLVKGKVTANDNPAMAKIEVLYTANGASQGHYHSNSASGKYLISLPTGNDYTIKYTVDGYEEHIEKVYAAGINVFTQTVIDVDLYSKDYQPKLTVDGNLLYSESPLRPAAYITMYVKDQSGGVTIKTTSTDARGYFRFTNLNAADHYYITLDEKDPDLKAFINPVIIGNAKVGGKGREGLQINDVTTKADGSFKLVFSDDKFLYSNLPTNIDELNKLNFNDPEIYQEVLEKFGDVSAKDLIFKVQVGAYNNPKNFDYNHLIPLGEVNIEQLKDGITRFTQGELKTLNQAEDLKHKIIGRGTTDAFILIFYQGKRRLLAEAVANGFYATQ